MRHVPFLASVAARGRRGLTSGAPFVAAPPPSPSLLGVGSTSTSLVDYPKTGPVTSGNWYVAPDAVTNGTGTLASPFNNLASAFSAVSAGQTILVRAGTLRPTTVIYRNTNWASTVRVLNYGTERPIIDCVNNTNLGNNGRAIAFGSTANREHWKGFEITNSNDVAVDIEGTNITIEDVWAHHCYNDITNPGRGVIRSYRSGVNGHLIQDCRVWRNGDGVSTGTNAPDCYQVQAGTMGTGVAFVRCFGAHGADDCFDLIRGNDGFVIDCVAYKGGYYWNGLSAGDGSGFKMGGNITNGGNNVARGGIAIGCKSEAVKPNSAPRPVSLLNLTVVNSVGIGMNFQNNPTSGGTHTGTNNISLGNGTNVLSSDGTYSTERYNTWNSSAHAGGNADFPITNAQFANPASFDWSLDANSPGIGAGDTGGNLGASTLALEIAKEWVPVADGSEPPAPPPEIVLLGVGSTSTSLVDYPKVQNTVNGNWYVDASVVSSGNGQSLVTAFKTFAEGLSALQNGQTLLVKGGTYTFTGTINRSTNWAAQTRIMGYGTDRPVLNFNGISARCVYFTGSNELWHRFHITNNDMVRDPTRECLIHTGHEGMYAYTGASDLVWSDIWASQLGGEGFRFYRADDCRVLDCATWKLGDVIMGNSCTSPPDGFICSGSGTAGGESNNNVFARCVAVDSPDDGFDCFSGINTLYVDCVSLRPGWYYDGTVGRGRNGFKMGGGTGTNNTCRGGFVYGYGPDGTTRGGRGFNDNGGSMVNFISGTVLGAGWASAVVNTSGGVTHDMISLASENTNPYSVSGTNTHNVWNLGITAAGYASPGSPDWDYSLGAGSACLAVGYQGDNLGASDIALAIAKEWLAKDLT